MESGYKILSEQWPVKNLLQGHCYKNIRKNKLHIIVLTLVQQNVSSSITSLIKILFWVSCGKVVTQLYLFVVC